MDTIPPEILTQIIQDLWEVSTWKLCCPSPLDKDLLLENLRNVRLVCSGFKAAASKIFGENYFSSREVIFEQKSLSTLLAIAKSKEFRRYFMHLIVNTFQFAQELTQWPAFKEEMHKVRWDPHVTFIKTKDASGQLPFHGVNMLTAFAAYRKFYQMQKRMNNYGAFKAQLAESLALLKKGNRFRHLTISGHNRAPAFRHITEKIGLDKRYECPESDTLITTVVCEIMQALYWSRINLCSFNLDRCGVDHVMLPNRYIKFLKAEAHIHDLNLELQQNMIDDSGHSNVHDIVQACPQLVSLSISFPAFVDFPLATAEEFFGSKRLERLEKLYLHAFSIDAQELANVLYRHRSTLKSIAFEDMILKSGHWLSVFKFIHAHLKLVHFEFHNIYQAGVKEYHKPNANLMVKEPVLIFLSSWEAC
jgi:hypothetical protein